MTTKTQLEQLARAYVDGRMGYKIMYYEQLNPEQKLAYVLEKLLGHQKETLALMEVCKLVAEEAVAWKKTPEGVAWAEERARKRSTDAANLRTTVHNTTEKGTT